MKDLKYIGLDVHLASISIAVRDAAGKLVMEATVETQAAALLDFIQGVRGALHVALEEGAHAEWLHGLLAPRVAEVVVSDSRKIHRRPGEKKNDRLDARKLAELLRLGALVPVYHGHAEASTLRELARSYTTLVGDTTRVMSRLKALYRGRGIGCRGTRVYSSPSRAQWLQQLQEAGVRRRAELLYEQLDALQEMRQKARAAMVEESRRHAAAKILGSVPYLGPVRVALLMAWLRTPYRFRGKRQLWSYAGLSLVTRSSADYRLVDGELMPRHSALVLGLNANHHHGVKALFKDAAASAIARPGPLREFYEQRIAQGMKPELARLTLARKIAATALHLWKKGEHFSAEYLKPQAA